MTQQHPVQLAFTSSLYRNTKLYASSHATTEKRQHVSAFALSGSGSSTQQTPSPGTQILYFRALGLGPVIPEGFKPLRMGTGIWELHLIRKTRKARPVTR